MATRADRKEWNRSWPYVELVGRRDPIGVFEWLEDPERSGQYYRVLISRGRMDDTTTDLIYYFSDPAVALEFKMRWFTPNSA